jgi:hypothetical protein
MTRTERTAPAEPGSRFDRGDAPPAPAPSVPSSPLVWPAIAWLALLGALAVVIGGHDTVVGTEITARIWGTIVLGAGAVLISGAIGLHRAQPLGRALAMVAAWLGAALGAMTFLVQVVNDEPDRRLALWTLIAALSVGAAWVVHSVTPEDERGKGLGKRLPVLKSVVSVGLAFSLAQFWYTSIYIPTTAPASLTLETKLTPKRVGENVVLEGSVTVRNTSGTRVSLVASVLDVSAANTKVATHDEGAGPVPGLPDDDLTREIAAAHESGLGAMSPTTDSAGRRYGTIDGTTTVARGRLLDEASYFEPNETVTAPFVAWVPAKGFDVVTASVMLVLARSRALALEDASMKPQTVGNRTVWTREIPEAGWLRRLTRGDRFLRVGYHDDPADEPVPDIAFSTRSDGARDDGFDGRMWRFYGVNRATSSALVPLVPAS